MTTPADIFQSYEKLREFKSSLGSRGIYEQSKMNERFYIGDQWNGVSTGSDRPLVRNNVIKRIADLKLSTVNNPVAVNFSADGVPETLEMKERVRSIKNSMPENIVGLDYYEEINLVMSAMSDYFEVTSERLNFDKVREQALINAYISGTGIVYTYWDSEVETGLYLNRERTAPIRGDIAVETLDVENVYFGDSTIDDIQTQPYIIIAQKLSIDDIKAEARENKVKVEPMPDDSYDNKATVLTKLYKKKKNGKTTVMGIRVLQNGVLRPEWDLDISLYPLAKYTFLRRKNCPYGESEITYLIPNQIAINRMITASSWATMVMGMPIMVVNNDIVRGKISNDPGQIIRVSGDASEVASAIRYVTPPSFSANFENAALSLSSVTLNMAGANDAALGDIAPDNTSAIIAVREAALLPMQTLQNDYYRFCEEIARIWAEFWVQKYGNRSLKIQDENGTWYMPFEAERYRDLLINARVDVGASTIVGEAQSLKTLDNLLDRQILDTMQYLKRLPAGTVPDVTGLIRELEAKSAWVSDTAEIPAPSTAPAVGTEITADAAASETEEDEILNILADIANTQDGAGAEQPDNTADESLNAAAAMGTQAQAAIAGLAAVLAEKADVSAEQMADYLSTEENAEILNALLLAAAADDYQKALDILERQEALK